MAQTSLIQTSVADTSNSIPVSLSAASVFDHAFDILKSNFVPLVLIVAFVFLPLHLVEQYIVSSWLNPRFTEITIQNSAAGSDSSIGQMFILILEYLPTGYPQFGVPGIMFVLAAIFASAPVTAAVAQVLAGSQITVSDSYRAAWATIMHVIWSTLLAGLCCFAVWAICTAVISSVGLIPLAMLFGMATVLSDPNVAGSVTLVYFLVCIIVPFATTCLFYGRIFAFVIPVCVNERTSTMEGVARSQMLGSCVPMRTTLLTFTMLPLAVLAVQFMLVIGCISGLKLLEFSPLWNFIASAAICGLFVCVAQAYWMVYVTRLYFDYRTKRECLDIRMLMDTTKTISRESAVDPTKDKDKNFSRSRPN